MAKDAGDATARLAPSKAVAAASNNNAKAKKISERLEEDAQEMEARLQQLRLNLLEEKKKREKALPLKHAGNRWRSAREDRGSVSRYASDVQTRQVKSKSQQPESGDRVKKSKNKARESAKPPPAPLILSMVNVTVWTNANVMEWLQAIGLEEYQGAFEFHQVTGEHLLQLQADDLATLGISRLSARNTILHEIEKMQQEKSQSPQRQQQQRSKQHPTEIIDPKLRDATPQKPTGVHWSQLQPLADNVTTGDGQVPINLADGEFNEADSHASFMKAVLEWRASDAIAEVDEQEEQADDEMWVNPMFSGVEEKPELSAGEGGALLEGSYDEEREHASFLQALQAWRGSEERPRSSRAVDQTEQGCATNNERKSCWQCYRVVVADSAVQDTQTQKAFCSSTCQATFHQEYARFYPSTS